MPVPPEIHPMRSTGRLSLPPVRQKAKGQTLSEYFMLAGLIGLIGLAGVVAVNGGVSNLFTLAKIKLEQGGQPQSGSRTNTQIAVAQSVPLPTATKVSASVSPTLSSAQIAQLTGINSILSSMNPADLPEISGSNSTTKIQEIIKSALLLTELANALERSKAGQNPNTGFYLNDLIFEAKKVALSQFFLAGTLLEGPGTVDPVTGKRLIVGPNITRGFQLLQDLVDLRPSDLEVQNLVTFYNNDYYDIDGARQIIQYNNYFKNYQQAYQPLQSAIRVLNIQTQQAAAIVTNGGNINHQSGANSNGSQTIVDINALKACLNATCS